MNFIQVGVPLVFVKEEDYIVAYCPALELSSYGNSEREATEAFEEAISIFLEETMQKGTLERVLIRLGWTLSRKDYEPPKYSPEQLFGLYRKNPAFNVRTERIKMPAIENSFEIN